MSNSLDPDQDRRFVGPDLGPNCLQRLSAEDKNLELSFSMYEKLKIAYLVRKCPFTRYSRDNCFKKLNQDKGINNSNGTLIKQDYHFYKYDFLILSSYTIDTV